MKSFTDISDYHKLYTNSLIRANIIRHIPFRKEDRVLEIGSVGGALTEYLKEQAGEVISVRMEQPSGLCQRGSFDYITLIDCFAEVAGNGCLLAEKSGHTEEVWESYAAFLQKLYTMLLPGGRILIAVENRLGLKYFAGNREEYSGKFFYGIEGYSEQDQKRSFSRKEWEKLLEYAGIESYSISYPFPDHVFPMQLFTDEYLPRHEELIRRSLNFDSDRMVLFDDERVMQSLLENDLFPQFSNSFLIDIRKNPDDHTDSLSEVKPSRVIYAKYANERDEKFALATFICENAGGIRSVQKVPLTRKAEEHILTIASAESKLQKIYRAKGIGVNRILKPAEQVTGMIPGQAWIDLEYLRGKTYESRVDAVLLEQGAEAALQLIDEYLSKVIPQDALEPFVLTDDFSDLFGLNRPIEGWEKSLPVTNIDAIMANMICDNAERTLGQMYDYEWTFSFPIPVQYLLWRIIHYYIETSQSRQILNLQKTCERFGVREEDIPVYQAMEAAFQAWVRGKLPTLQMYYEQFTPGAYSAQAAIYRERSDNALQVYFDTGSGFTEQNIAFYPTRDGRIEQLIPVPAHTRALRLDPGVRRCLCRVESIIDLTEDEKQSTLSFQTNGRIIDEKTILYAQDDPQIILAELPKPVKAIAVNLVFSPLWPELAEACNALPVRSGVSRVKKLFRGSR